ENQGRRAAPWADAAATAGSFGANPVGSILSHYRVDAEIGRGGMGIVYRAFDLRLERAVAVKVLSEDLRRDADMVARFVSEARAASALNHPHIATVYEIDLAEDGVPFIAMELVDGETLRRRLTRGPLALDDLLSIGEAAASALAEAHRRGVVHRDVKSENVMVTAEGHVKVMDFGLARRRTDPMETTTGQIIGTPAYMAPHARAGGKGDARSDVYAFGVMLYEAATGRLPFQRPNALALIYAIRHQEPPPVRELRPELPEAIETIVRRALRKKAADRFED